MDVLKQLFPLSFKVKDSNDCVISVIIYLVVSILFGVVVAILDFIPVINVLLGVLGSLVGVYCVAGIILSILKITKVMK